MLSEHRRPFGLPHAFRAPSAFSDSHAEELRVLDHESYPSGSALAPWSYIDIEASTFERLAISLPFERDIPFLPHLL